VSSAERERAADKRDAPRPSGFGDRLFIRDSRP
jgi:hypothetical protein